MESFDPSGTEELEGKSSPFLWYLAVLWKALEFLHRLEWLRNYCPDHFLRIRVYLSGQKDFECRRGKELSTLGKNISWPYKDLTYIPLLIYIYDFFFRINESQFYLIFRTRARKERKKVIYISMQWHYTSAKGLNTTANLKILLFTLVGQQGMGAGQNFHSSKHTVLKTYGSLTVCNCHCY